MSMRRKASNSTTTILLMLALVVAAASCKNDQDDHHHSEGENYQTIVQNASPSRQVLSRQSTVRMLSGTAGGVLNAQGVIAVAQNRNQSVAARYGGRIEKLYVEFSNQYVKKGERIMELYSPALRTMQEEHLFLSRAGGEASFIEESRERLSLLGITKNQIVQLEKNGTVATTITVLSPSSGYVFYGQQTAQQGNAQKGMASGSNMSMETASADGDPSAAPPSQIREGTYINEGQTLFTVNDLQEVWALISVPNEQLSQIHENQLVDIVSETNPSTVVHGKVLLIEKTFEDARQFFPRVRVALSNVGNTLKINSLVTAVFTLRRNSSMQVPLSAVYRTGLQSYVWVRTDTTRKGTGIFQVREVSTGVRNNQLVAIVGGLTAGEEIAVQAGLMIDSETYIR
ncbi:hypothetical protein BH10BAC6_BH10BAC6_16910 [soil metagenome]